MSRSQLDVAVVESQPLMRQGLVAALNGDPRLRVSLDEADSVALDRGGAVFDILEPVGKWSRGLLILSFGR